MNFLSTLTSRFKTGDAVVRLIYVNVLVFAVYYLVFLFFRLFNVPSLDFDSFLALPSDLNQLLHKPWTLVSYMFFHENFFHILFNMFALFWFGKLFLTYFNQKQLTAIYFIGGLAGALVYIVSFNVFPFFILHYTNVQLLGASGSIMAIIIAVAFQAPNLEMQMFPMVRVRLKWIAVFFVLASFFGITSNNAGGELAHLGGALVGYLFVVSLRKGKDLTKGINAVFDAISNLFKRRKLRVVKTKTTNRKMTDAEYNVYKAKNMQDIDRILDKIKTSGYESLSAEEKRKLFEQKK